MLILVEIARQVDKKFPDLLRKEVSLLDSVVLCNHLEELGTEVGVLTHRENETLLQIAFGIIIDVPNFVHEVDLRMEIDAVRCPKSVEAALTIWVYFRESRLAEAVHVL